MLLPTICRILTIREGAILLAFADTVVGGPEWWSLGLLRENTACGNLEGVKNVTII